MGLLEDLEAKEKPAVQPQLDLISMIKKRDKPEEKPKVKVNNDDNFTIIYNNDKNEYHYYYCRYNCDNCHTTLETDETLTREQVKCKNCGIGTLYPWAMDMRKKNKTAYEEDGVVKSIRQVDKEVDKLEEVGSTNSLLDMIKGR